MTDILFGNTEPDATILGNKQKLKDQYAFKSEAALACLRFKEALA